MQPHSFEEALALLLKEDPRYTAEAYWFVRASLDHTIRMLQKPDSGPARHVSGQQLLEGLRLFALQEYGPMARTVLRTWGITTTQDVGEIVFNLVGKGVLGKTPEDRKADFADGYDFDEAFVRPFQPARPAPAPAPEPAARRGAKRTPRPVKHQDQP
jgi:uncharacterized repeat protein (TIGR04138 family)